MFALAACSDALSLDVDGVKLMQDRLKSIDMGHHTMEPGRVGVVEAERVVELVHTICAGGAQKLLTSLLVVSYLGPDN